MIKASHLYLCASLTLGPLNLALAQSVAAPAPVPAAAASASEPATAQPSVATEAKPVAASKAGLSDRQLPRVVLRWDCGDCEPNEKVFPQIEKAYASNAAAKGYTVSDTETAEIVVVKYRQRPPGVRVMFGFMAGKDILETRVTFRGADFLAGDYSANSFHGMDSLCDTVAQMTFDKLLASLQSTAVNKSTSTQ